MATDRITGKSGSFTFNGISIPITKWSARTTKKLADITDNADYNLNTDLMWPTQLPVNAVLDVSVEGRFRLSVTPADLLAPLYTGLTAIPVTLALTTSQIYGHGNFDLSDFSCDLPVDDTVTFTCSLKSNGIFTPNG